MLTLRFSPLLRRRGIYVSLILFIFFAFGLGRFVKSSQYPLLLDFLSLSKSSYYSKGWHRYYSWRTRPFFPPLTSSHGGNLTAPDFCTGFPTHLLDRTQVVLKTGTGEPEKNKAHLATVTSCITNLIVFSDYDEIIGQHHFIDILGDLPSTYALNNPDFAAYRDQKLAHTQGGTVGYSQEGWRLDRFKFLPMVEKAYEMRPMADWYVFLEADTYYFWDTLFRLLDQLDPSMMHYIGSPVSGSDGLYFAYGGAGFVMSNGLMKRLARDSNSDSSLSVQYQDWAKTDCCGDAVLGYAILNETGVKLEGLYPTFAGEDLGSIKVDRERWCIPLLALHRMSPEQMTALWEWERTRPYNGVFVVCSSVLYDLGCHLHKTICRSFCEIRLIH